MKKILCLVLVFVVIFAAGMPTYAWSDFQGEYVGTVWRSQLVTYINNYPIPSYVLNGYTFIQAEDLSSFGFDVKWNEYNKTLRIIRNDNNEIEFKTTYIARDVDVGKKEFDMYTTEVKTYIGNYAYEIECYAGKPGCTYINVDNLWAFGEVQWVPELNQMKVWIKDGLECAGVPFDVPKDIRDTDVFEHGFYVEDNFDCYYQFEYGVLNDKVSFWYGEFAYKHGEIAAMAYCPYSKMYLEIYDEEGRRLHTAEKVCYGTNNMTVAPYLVGMAEAPLMYEISVPMEKLNTSGNYMARVTFWCSYCDGGHSEDIYFSV